IPPPALFEETPKSGRISTLHLSRLSHPILQSNLAGTYEPGGSPVVASSDRYRSRLLKKTGSVVEETQQPITPEFL
ncbi:MAG: hypothetical protein WCC94_00525, partial [Candidatus Bathyarchaeia archaeon]